MTIFNNAAIGALEFTVSWEKDGISHEEWFLGRKFNPVNDIFPRGMRDALEGKQAGDSVTFSYEPRLCIPRHKDKNVRTLDVDRLRKKTMCGQPIIPRLGRFYPQGHINGLRNINPSTLTPFRLVELNEERFTADCNHPLANIPITIKATIQYAEKRERSTYGSLSHWRETTCDWGPGMQTALNGQPTDFFLSGFFDRNNESDAPFSAPRIDDTAKDNFDRAHSRFLKPDMRVLTLSVDTPPQPTGEYDAVVCTQYIEYLADPVSFLQTISQHLKPDGIIIIGFTNHYDRTRVVHGWTDMHEFEHMGLVLDYLRQAGLDANAGTLSTRNDWRPNNDPLFLETRGVSDPTYVVYGYKKTL